MTGDRILACNKVHSYCNFNRYSNSSSYTNSNCDGPFFAEKCEKIDVICLATGSKCIGKGRRQSNGMHKLCCFRFTYFVLEL